MVVTRMEMVCEQNRELKRDSEQCGIARVEGCCVH